MNIRDWMANTQRAVHQGAGRGSVVLRRRYDESIDDVWSACTEPDRLARWFGTVTGDFRLGGTVFVEIGQPERLACTILECEAPRALVVTWTYGSMPTDHVELRLAPDGKGTLLELEHRAERDVVAVTGVGPGWEDWLFRLSTMLAGGDTTGLSSDDIQALLEPLWATVQISKPDRVPR
jgi:uncharacterized protein YndB with AHSA1/START domain